MPVIKKVILARYLLGIIFIVSLSSIAFSLEDSLSPTVPSDLVATSGPGSKVTLSWQKSNDNISVAGYEVYRKEAGSSQFNKISSKLITGLSFIDTNVSSGNNYEYIVRSVDEAGNASVDSKISSAPNIKMNENIIIMHMGTVVDTAVPGDSIEYVIDYTNNGFGIANDVGIVHSIPIGTTFLANSVKIKKGSQASILYFDKQQNKWVDTYSNEENVSKIKFTLNDPINATTKGPSGVLSFKVVVSI